MHEERPPQAPDRREPGVQMLTQHRQMALWTQGPLLVLGAWLVSSPFALGYESVGLTWSDVACGVLVILFSLLSFRRPWGPLANTAVGLWLLFAPLLFWAPSAAAYANDTLVGALVIGFALLIPMRMPMEGPDRPPGWSYNPSTWQQRIPIIALAVVSFLMARYMAAYQLGHIDSVWEPFFEPGTRRVLESEVSKAWPISDAGLGAIVYLIEALSGLMGDPRRWRTMPWMVAIFGVAVIPLGIVSIVLVIMQPVVVGAWCTLCLASALFMLLMIPLSLDEIVAMGQLLARSKRRGRPFWRTFFLGAHHEGDIEAESAARPSDRWTLSAAIWGVTVPWNLFLSAIAGIWLMASPAILGNNGLAADSEHLVGALVATVAIIAWAEVGRAVRYLNVVAGLWLLAAPWLLAGFTASGRWNDMALGGLLILLSLRRGDIRERCGSWDRFVF